MLPASAESSPSDRPVPAGPGISPHPVTTPQQRPRTEPARVLVVALAAGLAAGVASFVAGEVILNAYRGDLLPRLKIRPEPEDIRRLDAARIHSAAASYAMLGGMLGLALGLAGGLARRSASAGARAAILGLLLGAAAAASIALVIVPVFYKNHDPQSNDLVLPLFTHGAIWSTVGAVGGLAFGVGLGGRGRWMIALAGGLAGAAAATVVYEIAGALAFPTSKSDLPISATAATRAMAQLLVAILTATGVVLALRQSPNAAPSSPAAST